jgi:S-DNA-T family DNA segregation ATPase FtsK/SpoIIIE
MMISFFDKKVEKHIINLAEKSRATGIHLIIASYNFDKISNLLKAYLPFRLAFWFAYKREGSKY